MASLPPVYVGKIVHFVGGSEQLRGRCLPAIVVRMMDDERNRVVLTIFTDQIVLGATSAATREMSIGYSAEMVPDTWHDIEDCHHDDVTDQQQSKDSGTVKSIERQRGRGSIGPDSGSQVNADTRFTEADVAHDGFSTLQIGDHVQYNATLDPDHPGYADATGVELEPATSAADQAVKNQKRMLASGQENPG